MAGRRVRRRPGRRSRFSAGAAAPTTPSTPSSVANQPPMVRFFIAPGDTDGELNPTSYNRRTFSWSGSDQDGTVVAYYVSVRTARDVPAPWIETTHTDTTMTFTTDDRGPRRGHLLPGLPRQPRRPERHRRAVRAAAQFPARHQFPVRLRAVHQPAARDRPDEGGAPADTVYWNWGAMSVRLFAYDPDGGETMADAYRYTVADPLPDCVRPASDPAADPEVCWVEVPFGTRARTSATSRWCSPDLAPGRRTLTVAVSTRPTPRRASPTAGKCGRRAAACCWCRTTTAAW